MSSAPYVTSSVLSPINPPLSRSPTVRSPTSPVGSVPLAQTQFSSARLTGLVTNNTPVTLSTNAPPSPRTLPPSPSRLPVIPTPSSPSRVPASTMTPRPQVSPTARSALLNLSVPNGSPPTVGVVIPPMVGTTQSPSTLPRVDVPRRSNGEQRSTDSPSSSGMVMNEEFVVKDYQGLIGNASLENELLNAGYAPLSKIVIQAENGEKRTQYIKAVNKKGQKVFILVDVSGYTTARAGDLTLIEARKSTIVPYSVKTGAYDCAGRDVCGVAFECTGAVCVLARNSEDLTPTEANFVFVEQSGPAAATVESEGVNMTYPVIRLSEIRANPELILKNTDVVTRRLRNASYSTLVAELVEEEKAIIQLNQAFVRFRQMYENNAALLNKTLTQLEGYLKAYMDNPPTSDEGRDKFQKVQLNVAKRNDGIEILLRSMQKVADLRSVIAATANDINAIREFCEKEFATVELASTN